MIISILPPMIHNIRPTMDPKVNPPIIAGNAPNRILPKITPLNRFIIPQLTVPSI
jgi:hypothetical protein